VRALITGIGGFAGSHLARYLLSQKIQVTGFFHPEHPPTKNLSDIEKKIDLFPSDLSNQKKIKLLLKKNRPDYIFHLAAFASAALSFKSPKKTIENNVFSQLNLLEACSGLKPTARILVIGSSDEYGNIDAKNLPVNEEAPIAPVSPYALSKVIQDFMGLQYFLNRNLFIVRVRPFNHIGPGQSKNFVVPDFISQIVDLEKRGGGEIKVGNLEGSRDFTDVRDMVKAYLLALQKGQAGEVYNIGSGKPVKINDILKKLILLSKVKVKIEQDKNLLRPVDIEKIYCDFTKFRNQTSWSPQIPIEKTLEDSLNFEREKNS